MKIKQYINEDFFWERYRSLNKDSKDEFRHLLFSIGSSAQDLADKGKLSKITGNRIYNGCHRLYADGIKPSEMKIKLWKRGYNITFIRMDLLKTALRKFWKVSKEEEHKTLKNKIKFWERIGEKSRVIKWNKENTNSSQ